MSVSRFKLNRFEAFVRCTPMILHRINSSDAVMHQLGDIFDTCICVIFTSYGKWFEDSSGRGSHAVGVFRRVRHANFAWLPKRSCSVGTVGVHVGSL